MKNVIIIHSYNGDTKDSFAPSIENICKENNIDYYFPKFPIRSEATYESWEKVMDEYRDNNIINSDSIIISHSLGTQFIIKYLARNNIYIDKYISVAGFVNFKGREDLENILKQYTKISSFLLFISIYKNPKRANEETISPTAFAQFRLQWLEESRITK